MTDNYYKALGLPTNFQISGTFPRLFCEPYHEQFKTEAKHYGAKWMRDLAASRIKEVAADHNEWILKREGLIRGEYTDGQLTWWDDQTQRSYTKTSLFDLFIKERSGE